ncbi:glycosyltransferase [Serratia fonticola]|uniref:glycosyltransferase n=1 Tax=Serratia fonticola TaxID=47917 RepID=UPI0003FBDBA6|nr:glycosyltransferase [Serratia fonticola]AKG70717.1 hypothetical protein WN53_17220 [Serratia fonticola]NYA45572.1 glycosyltransferase [Serratia fonticola]CAI0751123.1 rhamnosyltransferase [Serratia fonticola]CAI1872519.1 rhamnosyltransferase [Serratia fonticola]
MEVDKNNICALIVTYGTRLDLIDKVIQSLMMEDVKGIIVVSNGQDTVSRTSLLKICNDERINVILNDENIGSAGGYCQGLKFFLENRKEDFVILLDDDNVISRNGLMKIADQYNENKNSKIVICANRKDRNIQQCSLDKKENILYLNDSFLGYNFLSYFKKEKSDSEDYIYSDIVPYGGMVLDRAIIEDVGLPDKDLFLYSDDYEYSLRIRNKGYMITILKSVSVTDIDQSWHVNRNGSAIIDPESSEMRVYYTVRNGVITDIRYKKKTLLFYINMIFFILIQILKDIRVGKLNFINPRNWSVFIRAFADAKKNKLGMVKFL